MSKCLPTSSSVLYWAVAMLLISAMVWFVVWGLAGFGNWAGAAAPATGLVNDCCGVIRSVAAVIDGTASTWYKEIFKAFTLFGECFVYHVLPYSD